MPDDALPVARATAPVGGPTHRLLRHYPDLLGRPTRGKVSITGRGDGNVIPATVVVVLVDGALDVNLPAGTYELVTNLITVDGGTHRGAETVTLPESGTTISGEN